MHKARVWRRLKEWDESLAHSKYHLKDVFLKLRFHKYEKSPSGSIVFPPEIELAPQPQQSGADLSDS